MPEGTSISAPSLVPAGTASLVAAGSTYDLAGTCEYTITFPDTPGSATPDGGTITFVGSGSDLYFPTGVADGIEFVYDGQECATSAEIVTAFGLAVAEQELVSGSCNTDSSKVWGYAMAVDTSEVEAGLVTESSFGHWFQSDESGSIFFGQFQECMQNPVGQHSNYVCSWNNYGPLF